MSPQAYERKLTTVLSTEIAGYGRFMLEDDDSTVRTLTGHRKTMCSLTVSYQGRVVDSAGYYYG